MNAEHAEKLKREYTDKYVAVDASRPDLARFKDLVGQVKAVNMSGRALVEFFDYHLNIGWYDIDVDHLKVVDKPLEKEETKAAEKKPAAKPAAKPGAKPTAKPADKEKKPAAAAGERKPSPLEMARAMDAKKKESPSPQPEKAAPSAPASEKKKMSTAEILAAARGDKGASAKPATQAPAAEKTSTEPATAEKTSSEDSSASSASTTATTTEEGGSVDLANLSREERIAIAKARGESIEDLDTTPPAADEPTVERRETPETVQTDVTEGEVVADASEEPADSAAEETEISQVAEEAAAQTTDQAETETETATATAEEPAPAGETVDRSQMSVEDILVWCRAHDGK